MVELCIHDTWDGAQSCYTCARLECEREERPRLQSVPIGVDVYSLNGDVYSFELRSNTMVYKLVHLVSERVHVLQDRVRLVAGKEPMIHLETLQSYMRSNERLKVHVMIDSNALEDVQ